MADSNAIIPYHPPADETFTDYQSPFTIENPTLGLLEYPNLDLRPEFDNTIDGNDPFIDPSIWNLGYGSDQNLVSNHLDEPSGEINESNNINHNAENSTSPVFRPLDSCICCQRLREITHVNGVCMKKLEIHGRVGMITHTVLEIYDLSTQNYELKMFDFSTKSIPDVKQFLLQYYEDCKQEGYFTLQDPLSTFYEALSVGVNDNDNFDDFVQSSPDVAGDYQMNEQEMSMQHEDEINTEQYSTKISLSEQRARTVNMKLEDLVVYFDRPIDGAARSLNVCPTVMKKICRRNGLRRWPYRKIRSIKKKIFKTNEILNSASSDEEREQAEADIRKYQQELGDIYNVHS